MSLPALPSSRQSSLAPRVTETFLYLSAAKLLSPLPKRLMEGRFGGQRGSVMGSLVPCQRLEQDLPLYCLRSRSGVAMSPEGTAKAGSSSHQPPGAALAARTPLATGSGLQHWVGHGHHHRFSPPSLVLVRSCVLWVMSTKVSGAQVAPKAWPRTPWGHHGGPMHPALGWHPEWMPCGHGTGRAGRDAARSPCFAVVSQLLLMPCCRAPPQPRRAPPSPRPSCLPLRGDDSRDTKHTEKGCSTGRLLARFAIHGTNLSEIHFRRKNIFNSTVCNHLIKVIRSESARNNVQPCVTTELATALSGQPRPGWDT